MNATFSLFKNNYKDADNKPDYKGNGKDESGAELDIAAWVRNDKNGKPYFSIKVQPKRESTQSAAAAPKPAPVTTKSISEDELPFN